jgi:hypothetical protein
MVTFLFKIHNAIGIRKTTGLEPWFIEDRQDQTVKFLVCLTNKTRVEAVCMTKGNLLHQIGAQYIKL